MTSEKLIKAKSGWAMLVITVLVFAASCVGLVWSIMLLATADDAGLPEPPYAGPMMLVGFLLLALGFVLSSGFIALQPGEAKVCLLFGNYIGTIRESGFYWANPFYSRKMSESGPDGEVAEEGGKKGTLTVKAAGISTKVSLRARTHNGERIKVNDKQGNPIEIATVVVWRVSDTAKALFDVDNYISYVSMQTETALRHVASIYAYDHMEDDDAANTSITLRSNIEEVSNSLKEELGLRLAPAAVWKLTMRVSRTLPMLPRSRPRCFAVSRPRPSSPLARRSSREPSRWWTWRSPSSPTAASLTLTRTARQPWRPISWWCSAASPRRSRCSTPGRCTKVRGGSCA